MSASVVLLLFGRGWGSYGKGVDFCSLKDIGILFLLGLFDVGTLLTGIIFSYGLQDLVLALPISVSFAAPFLSLFFIATAAQLRHDHNDFLYKFLPGCYSSLGIIFCVLFLSGNRVVNLQLEWNTSRWFFYKFDRYFHNGSRPEEAIDRCKRNCIFLIGANLHHILIAYLEDVIVIGLVDDGEWSDGCSEVGSVGDEFVELDICTIGHRI